MQPPDEDNFDRCVGHDDIDNGDDVDEDFQVMYEMICISKRIDIKR